MYSLSILSLPEDLPFFNFCTTNRFAKNKKDDQSNISIETLYDYFKNLNTNIDNNNIDIDINIDNLSPKMEEILNSPKKNTSLLESVKQKYCLQLKTHF
jgi:hypothetical protein